jgi:hypothetical protein
LRERRHAERVERSREVHAAQTIVDEDDLVVVAPELGHVLGVLLEPRAARLGVETGRRELDDPETFAAELVEQRLEQRVGDDGDATCARIAQRRSAPSRFSSSSGS